MSSASDLDLMQTIDCDDGSSSDLTKASHLEYKDGSVAFVTKTGSGHMSPVRARTMKEYDQQIAELHKENFNLKLRIYFLEERMKTDWDIDSESVLKENIELKVEVESLKKDLIDRQELLKKASSALSSQTISHQVELQHAKESALSEGQRLGNKDLESMKLCIEDLQKELNAKREELDNLQLHSRDTEVKLNDLLAINRQMDSRWRQLERDKKALETRLELLGAVEKETEKTETDGTTPKDVSDEVVVRKDRLIEQLRCALKAKDVIIEQVEEEKREAVKETASELQKQITQLQAKVLDRETAPEMSSAIQPNGSPSVGKSQASLKVMEKPNRVFCDAIMQTSEQSNLATGFDEDQMEALSQVQAENEKFRKQMNRREKEVMQLIDQLEKADESLKLKNQQLKDMTDSFNQERQKNAEKILELDAQYKVLFDDAHQHSSNQDEMISRLTQRLRLKDEQMEKLLQLSNHQDVTHMHTKITEIIREIQKENNIAVEEAINENDSNLKSRMDDLKKELVLKTKELDAVRSEMSDLHQTIADIERKLSDELLSKMAETFKDQQYLKESEKQPQFDDSSRENILQLLLDILAVRDRRSEGVSDCGSLTKDVENILSAEALRAPESSKLNESLRLDVEHRRIEAEKTPTKQTLGSFSSFADESCQTDEILSICEKDEVIQLRAEIENLRKMVNVTKAEQLNPRRNERNQLAEKMEKPSHPLVTTDAVTMNGTQFAEVRSNSLGSPDGRYYRQSNSAKGLEVNSNGRPRIESVPDLNESSRRELRFMSPRSNISYLSVESSKRWATDEGDAENLLTLDNPHVSQLKMFQLLLPDESTLSGKSSDQLREIIRGLGKALNDTGALWDGSQCASPSSIISLQTLEQQSNLLESHTDHSMMEYSFHKKQLEKKLEEKEGVIYGVNMQLEEMSSALSQNRVELTQALKKNEELLRLLDAETRQLQGSQEALAALEIELKQIKEEFESVLNANVLLKEQIQLNAQVNNSSLGFNPDLIVRLSKEVDRMKKELTSRETGQDKKTDDSARLSLKSDLISAKIDQSTSTEDLQNSVSSPLKYHHHLEGGMAVFEGGKSDHKNNDAMATSDQNADARSSPRDQNAGDGRTDLTTGMSSDFEGRFSVEGHFSEGRKSNGSSKEIRRSLIPVSLKGTKSQSLDEENDICVRVKCVQLETRLLMMQSRTEDQSRQIARYRDLLKEVDPKDETPRTPDTRGLSDEPLSASKHDASAKTKICASPLVASKKSSNASSVGKEKNGKTVDPQKEGEDGVDSRLPSSDRKSTLDSSRLSNVWSTPFDVTKAANLHEFVRLKSEVRRLKTLLNIRDSSHLSDTMPSNADGTFCMPEVSFSIGDNLPSGSRQSASAEQFLWQQKHDYELLRHDLARSQQNYNLLRARLEELLEYLEKQMKASDSSSFQSSSLRGKLSETRHLIQDLSESLDTTHHGSARMSLPDKLSHRNLDSSSMIGTEDDEHFYRGGRPSMYESVRKDYTFSEEPSELEMERQTLRQHVVLLEHECGLLEEHVRRKEVELEERLNQKQLELNSVLAEASDLRSQASGLFAEVESLRASLSDEKEMSSAMKSELIELKRSSQSLQETSEDLRRKIEMLGEERNELVTENHRLNLVLTSHETKSLSLERELIELDSKRVEDLRRIQNDYQQQISEFDLEKSTLLTKIHVLSSEVQALKVEVVRERDRADAAEVAEQSCHKKLADKDEMIRKLRELVKENQKMAEDLRIQLHRLNEDVQQKKLTIRRLSQKCQELQNSFLRFKPDDMSLSEETDTLRNSQTEGNASNGDRDLDLSRKVVRGESLQRENQKEVEDLRAQVVAAKDMIGVLKSELKVVRRHNRSGSAGGEDDAVLMDHMEEIKELRQQLEQSLKRNDQLRESLSRQLGREGSNAENQTTDHLLFGASESTRLTQDVELAEKEISVQKTRLHRLKSDLKEHVSQLEALEVEKNSVHKKIDASKMKLENSRAEIQRLKAALDESGELSQTLKLELRLMNEVKLDDKENQNAVSVNTLQNNRNPSRMQLTDLLTEVRQLRLQLEKAIENNDTLRSDLERLSQNKIEYQSQNVKVHSGSEFTSVHTFNKLSNGVEGHFPDANQTPRGLGLSAYAFRRDIANDGTLNEDQSHFAVANQDVFERLKLEISRNQSAVGQLEKSIRAIHAEVIEDERKQSLCGAILEMRTIVNEQVRLTALFWMLNLSKPDPNSSFTAKAVENELLRKQLNELRDRYSRAKHAMKGAQQRLEANNRKKQEFFAMQKNRKDLAIQEQITKTHQVLVQSRRNLESFHDHFGDASS